MRDGGFELAFSGVVLAARTRLAFVMVLPDFRRSLEAVAVLVDDAAMASENWEQHGSSMQL